LAGRGSTRQRARPERFSGLYHRLCVLGRLSGSRRPAISHSSTKPPSHIAPASSHPSVHSSPTKHRLLGDASRFCEIQVLSSAHPPPRYAINVRPSDRHGQSASKSQSCANRRYRYASKPTVSTRQPDDSPSAEASVCCTAHQQCEYLATSTMQLRLRAAREVQTTLPCSTVGGAPSSP
jgi:hypothetical protein